MQRENTFRQYNTYVHMFNLSVACVRAGSMLDVKVFQVCGLTTFMHTYICSTARCLDLSGFLIYTWSNEAKYFSVVIISYPSI